VGVDQNEYPVMHVHASDYAPHEVVLVDDDGYSTVTRCEGHTVIDLANYGYDTDDTITDNDDADDDDDMEYELV
jgi:hypothetical protein